MRGMDTSPNPFQSSNPTSASTTTEELGTNVGEMIDRQLDVRPEQMNTEEAEPSQPMQSSRCNVGKTEQKFRLGAGAALLAAAAFAPVSRGWRIGFAVLGAAELVTGTTRYCPVSKMLGINTCRPGEE
jgi:hypothetical protein